MEVGCPLYPEIFGIAAGGHLKSLKFLYEVGCPRNEWAFINALRGGHLDCLKFLHEKGCSYSKIDCLKMAQRHPECLRYVVECM
jgi:hypothetical protein